MLGGAEGPSIYGMIDNLIDGIVMVALLHSVVFKNELTGLRPVRHAQQRHNMKTAIIFETD